MNSLMQLGKISEDAWRSTHRQSGCGTLKTDLPVQVYVVSHYEITNENYKERTNQCREKLDAEVLTVPCFLCVCLDYPVPEFDAVERIEDIPWSYFKAVDQAAIPVPELFLHDVEDVFTNTEPLDHFVLVKIRGDITGLV